MNRSMHLLRYRLLSRAHKASEVNLNVDDPRLSTTCYSEYTAPCIRLCMHLLSFALSIGTAEHVPSISPLMMGTGIIHQSQLQNASPARSNRVPVCATIVRCSFHGVQSHALQSTYLKPSQEDNLASVFPFTQLISKSSIVL